MNSKRYPPLALPSPAACSYCNRSGVLPLGHVESRFLLFPTKAKCAFTEQVTPSFRHIWNQNQPGLKYGFRKLIANAAWVELLRVALAMLPKGPKVIVSLLVKFSPFTSIGTYPGMSIYWGDETMLVIVGTDAVIVIVADADMVVSAVDVAVMVAVAAPRPEGVKVIAVPEATVVVAESVPAVEGVTVRFAVVASEPVTATASVTVAVCISVMVWDCGVSVMLVTAFGGFTVNAKAVLVLLAEYPVDVAVMFAVPAAFAVTTPVVASTDAMAVLSDAKLQLWFVVWSLIVTKHVACAVWPA